MTIPDRWWPPPPTDLALPGGEVHVWCASLDLPAPLVQCLRRTLTVDELGRAARFRLEKDRRHFIVARGLLRAILGRYLHAEPGQLRFCTSDYGKPALAPTPGREMLGFNLSHSDGVALYAVARGRRVGIDLERIRPIAEAAQIAERLFSAQEKAVFRRLPASLKRKAFFACWTRKEAYVKARGEGLTVPLDRFDVSLAPGEPAMLLRTRGDPQESVRWSLRELPPVPGYVAALAVEGHGWYLACWRFPGATSGVCQSVSSLS
jgi:4'-phosphopantetheinyl transferase